MLLRRHTPAEKAIELLNGEVATAAKDSDAGVRAGAARTLAAACSAADPADDRVAALKKVATDNLPKLSSDADGAVKAPAAYQI